MVKQEALSARDSCGISVLAMQARKVDLGLNPGF